MKETKEKEGTIPDLVLFLGGILSLTCICTAFFIIEVVYSSKIFWEKAGNLFFAFLFLGMGIAIMCFYAKKYACKYGKELFLNVLIASSGISFGAWFVFWKIADAAGLYFLSVWMLAIGYFVVAFLTATKLHKYWVTPYAPGMFAYALKAGAEDLLAHRGIHVKKER